MLKSKEILQLIKLRIQALYLIQENGITPESFPAIEHQLHLIADLMLDYKEATDD